MIVTCSNCSAKFAVKAEDIGEDGRKVRCSICRHVWFQVLPPELPEILKSIAEMHPDTQEVQPIPEGSNLPAEISYSYREPVVFKAVFTCLVVILIFITSLVGNNKIRPYLGTYYNALGIYDDRGIILYNATAEKNNSETGQELLVKGRIVNESNSEKLIPNLRITLTNENYKSLRVVTLDSQGTLLMPGEGVNFENNIHNFPEGVSNVLMDIGNSVSLAAR